MEKESINLYKTFEILSDDSLKINILDYEINLLNNKNIVYQRKNNNEVTKTIILAKDKDKIGLMIYPITSIENNKFNIDGFYLKFKDEILLDSKQNSEFTIGIPIQIGVFKIKKDYKKMDKLIDSFSIDKISYGLYGEPQKGFICIYKEVEINKNKYDIYKEAEIKIKIKNNLKKPVKINKIIIPMNEYVVEYDEKNKYNVINGTIKIEVDSRYDLQQIIKIDEMSESIELVIVKFTNIKLIRNGTISHNQTLPDFIMEHGY
ncbi:MAG: DUF432 domain-containing protein [Nitrososphaeraceae archaeon]